MMKDERSMGSSTMIQISDGESELHVEDVLRLLCLGARVKIRNSRIENSFRGLRL